MEPRRPFFTTSPTTAVEEGSPTMRSDLLVARFGVSITRVVPLMKGPSSSEVIRKAMDPE